MHAQNAQLLRWQLKLQAEGLSGHLAQFWPDVMDSVWIGGQGSVHHIAFRARDLAHQAEMAEAARGLGLNPTEVIDRQYFESVYFREPGGVLFEIATDEPGFTVDEDAAELGQALRLPPRYEPRRAAIEAALPPLD